MAIEFVCNQCYQHIETPDGTGGKKGRCPHCSTIMIIPYESVRSHVNTAPIATGYSAAAVSPSYGQSYSGSYQQPADDCLSEKSKIAAGILGIFLGGWGVHRFYLGDVETGLAQIFVTLITCGVGALWGFIEGIMILAGSIDRDAYGRKLRD